ncbi:uncharacterized protein E5676_scaffold566G00050 [Cucumis melo var. makuwa]|uniref:Uncharacterized protein n=1 Tax=Cucumis melo var. makuwa TaxID=1194695 RepID=A0A5D3BV32_CUCMM|nr:uncharacterized protein E6C27_scaffold778G00320 [Cucumis melo var. makuwa]TYK03317.1 uncharacterized protein E5676_scaffold566G00050 [Cucumis melo var. makuwa]
MTHEITMKEHLEDESKKKKSIALKTISLEVDPEYEDGLDEDDLGYFSYNIRMDCPHLKSSKKSKKKAMKTIWDNSSESGSEVEEMAHLGLMAHSDKEDEHDDEDPNKYGYQRIKTHDMSCPTPAHFMRWNRGATT